MFFFAFLNKEGQITKSLRIFVSHFETPFFFSKINVHLMSDAFAADICFTVSASHRPFTTTYSPVC